MIEKTFFLFLLIFPALGFAQTDSPSALKKVGVGIGYSFNSVMSDSIRPVELSLRYRINERHTLQLFVPVSYKRSSISDSDNVRKVTLWGIGLGYDYTFYTYSHLDFFAGLSAGYHWFHHRHDINYKYQNYPEDEAPYEVKATYDYWDKASGFVLTPNAGIRFSIGKIILGSSIDLLFSDLKKKSYSLLYLVYPTGTGKSETFYPGKDKEINELKLSSNISVNISYCF